MTHLVVATMQERSRHGYITHFSQSELPLNSPTSKVIESSVTHGPGHPFYCKGHDTT